MVIELDPSGNGGVKDHDAVPVHTGELPESDALSTTHEGAALGQPPVAIEEVSEDVAAPDTATASMPETSVSGRDAYEARVREWKQELHDSLFSSGTSKEETAWVSAALDAAEAVILQSDPERPHADFTTEVRKYVEQHLRDEEVAAAVPTPPEADGAAVATDTEVVQARVFRRAPPPTEALTEEPFVVAAAAPEDTAVSTETAAPEALPSNETGGTPPPPQAPPFVEAPPEPEKPKPTKVSSLADIGTLLGVVPAAAPVSPLSAERSVDQTEERKKEFIEKINNIGTEIKSISRFIRACEEKKRQRSDDPEFSAEKRISAERDRLGMLDEAKKCAVEIAGFDTLRGLVRAGDRNTTELSANFSRLPRNVMQAERASVAEFRARRDSFAKALPGVDAEIVSMLRKDFVRQAEKLTVLHDRLSKRKDKDNYHLSPADIHLLHWYGAKEGTTLDELTVELGGIVEMQNAAPAKVEVVLTPKEQERAAMSALSRETLKEQIAGDDEKLRASAEAEWERRALRQSNRRGTNRELKQTLADIKSGNGANVPEKWLQEFQEIPVVSRYLSQRVVPAPAVPQAVEKVPDPVVVPEAPAAIEVGSSPSAPAAVAVEVPVSLVVSEAAPVQLEAVTPGELTPPEKLKLVTSLNELRAQLDAQYALRRDPVERSKFDPQEVERINRLTEETAAKLVGPEVLRAQVKTKDKNWRSMTFKERGDNLNANQRAEYFATEKRRDAFKKALTEEGVEKDMAGVVYRRFMEQASALERISHEIDGLMKEGKPSPVVTEESADFRTLRLHGVPEDLIKEGKLAEILAMIAPQVDEYAHVPLPQTEGTPAENVLRRYLDTNERLQFQHIEQFSDVPGVKEATIDKVHTFIKGNDTEAIRKLPAWVAALMSGDAVYEEFVHRMPEAPKYQYHYQNEETKRSYLEQLKKLHDEREEAKSVNDTSRTSKLQNEIDKLNTWYHAPFVADENAPKTPEGETTVTPPSAPESVTAAVQESDADIITSKDEQDAMLNDASLNNIQRTYLTNRHEIIDGLRAAEKSGNNELVMQFEVELERMNAWYNAATLLGVEADPRAAPAIPSTVEAIAPIGDAYWSAFDANLSPDQKKINDEKTKGMSLEPMTPRDQSAGIFDANAVPLTERARVSGELPVLTDRLSETLDINLNFDGKIDFDPTLPAGEATPTKPIERSVSRRFENSFRGITEGDLERIPGFANLTEGQQLLTLKNLQSMVFDKVKDQARDTQAEEWKNTGWVKKTLQQIWHWGTKPEKRVAELEKQLAKKQREGEGRDGRQFLAENLVSLTDLVQVAANGPEVEVLPDGNIKINYVSKEGLFGKVGEKTLTGENLLALERYNKAADEFAKYPHEWGYDADKSRVGMLESMFSTDRKKYNKARVEYDAAREGMFALYTTQAKERASANGDKHPDRTAALEMNKIDEQVQMNQLFNTHPDAENALLKMENQSVTRVALKEFWKAKGSFIAFGAVTRAAAVALSGGIALPAIGLIGGVVGAGIGREDAKRLIKQRRKDGRMSQQDLREIVEYPVFEKENNQTGKVKINEQTGERKILRYEKRPMKEYTDATFFIDRIERLTNKLEQATEPAERELLERKVVQTVTLMKEKKARGMINFGGSSLDARDERRGATALNRLDFTKAIAKGEFNTTIDRHEIENMIHDAAASHQGKIEAVRGGEVWKGAASSAFVRGVGALGAGYLMQEFVNPHIKNWYGMDNRHTAATLHGTQQIRGAASSVHAASAPSGAASGAHVAAAATPAQPASGASIHSRMAPAVSPEAATATTPAAAVPRPEAPPTPHPVPVERAPVPIVPEKPRIEFFHRDWDNPTGQPSAMDLLNNGQLRDHVHGPQVPFKDQHIEVPSYRPGGQTFNKFGYPAAPMPESHPVPPSGAPTPPRVFYERNFDNGGTPTASRSFSPSDDKW